MIFGSIWPNDVSIFAPWLNQSTNPYFIILAPHDISQGMRKKITSHIGKEYKLLSECHDQTQPEDGIMVDTIGDLAHLYQYGHIAYIGGGFGKGIHSILEPVAAGLPVIFGPNYHRFQEAKELIHLGAAISIKSSHEFKEAMEFFSNEDHYRAAKQGIASFLSHHQGATLKVVQYLANRKYIS